MGSLPRRSIMCVISVQPINLLQQLAESQTKQIRSSHAILWAAVLFINVIMYNIIITICMPCSFVIITPLWSNSSFRYVHDSAMVQFKGVNTFFAFFESIHINTCFHQFVHLGNVYSVRKLIKKFKCSKTDEALPGGPRHDRWHAPQW